MSTEDQRLAVTATHVAISVGGMASYETMIALWTKDGLSDITSMHDPDDLVVTRALKFFEIEGNR
jgi:hypothetical protein